MMLLEYYVVIVNNKDRDFTGTLRIEAGLAVGTFYEVKLSGTKLVASKGTKGTAK